MDDVFLALLLISILALIIWLIRPKLFSKLFNGKTNRKTIGLVFGSAIVLFFILFGVTVPPTAKTTTIPTPTTNTSTPTQTPTPKTTPSSTPTPQEVTYREAAKWNKAGKTWQAIVFSKKPSNDELIKVAKELHQKNKTDYYTFFDDDAKLQEFINWDINYGLTASTETYPYPEEWAKAHELAIMNEMYSGGSMKWQLTSSVTFEVLSDI